MDNTSKWKKSEVIIQANSSESTMNTREEYAMEKGTNELVAEAPTVETRLGIEAIPEVQITLDTEITPDTDVTSDAETLQPRSLDDIREEFCSHYRTGSESVYIMGKLLNEAKAQLPEHLKWLDWLHSVNFPERQAQRLMKLATGYPDPTTLSYLGQSKALALLKVEEDKRDLFIEEAHMISDRGVLLPKNVRQMSVRQLEGAIRAHNGTSKKKAQKSTSQALPLMSHSDALEASEPASEFDRQFEYLQLCINSLLDHIEGLVDSSDERDELADKLRQLCNEALQRIPMRKVG